MFDVFRTTDGNVSKYIHDDGSETAIKKVLSEQNIVNPITRKIETHKSERRKYSIFISCSVGCHMKCGFCHLTLKNAKYSKLTAEQILANLKEALEDAISVDPEIRERYIKLSWMGMGDALHIPHTVDEVTTKFLTWVFENKYAVGLDGVDLSTVMPKVAPTWIPVFHALEHKLHVFPKSPFNESDNAAFSKGELKRRNTFRLFYSLGSAVQEIKDTVIPNATSLDDAIVALKQYEANGEHSVIIHHLLVDGMNDTDKEIDAICDLFSEKLADNELRLLRYNSCLDRTMQESTKVVGYIERLSKTAKYLKVQVSPGSEVSAACGQFIVKVFK